MLYVQSVSFKICDEELLENKNMIQRICRMSACCANIRGESISYTGEAGHSYACHIMSKQAWFSVSVHPHQKCIVVSLHSYDGHEVLEKIVEQLMKRLKPDANTSQIRKFSFKDCPGGNTISKEFSG